MSPKTYTEAELKEIACKFATWYREEVLVVNTDYEISDNGYPVEMEFDKFKAIEL